MKWPKYLLLIFGLLAPFYGGCRVGEFSTSGKHIELWPKPQTSHVNTNSSEPLQPPQAQSVPLPFLAMVFSRLFSGLLMALRQQTPRAASSLNFRRLLSLRRTRMTLQATASAALRFRQASQASRLPAILSSPDLRNHLSPVTSSTSMFLAAERLSLLAPWRALLLLPTKTPYNLSSRLLASAYKSNERAKRELPSQAQKEIRTRRVQIKVKKAEEEFDEDDNNDQEGEP